MSKPLLNQTSTVALRVDSDRKLRADAIISQQRNNALEDRSNGLFVEEFTPVGALIVQRPLIGQTIPSFAANATASPSMIIYDSAAADSAGMWDPVSPTRLTIRRTARYLISSHGRWRSSGVYTGLYAWAWIGKNGDEQTPLAVYNPNVSGPIGDPAVLASPAGGGVNDLLTGTYHMQNLVDLVAGDYLTTFVMFQSGAGVGGTVTTQTSLTPRGDLGSNFLGAVSVSE